MSAARILLLSILLALSLQGQAPAATQASTVSVAFLQGEQLVPVRRPGRTAADAVRDLLAGPTPAEKTDGFRTYIPSQTKLRTVTTDGGLATVDLTAGFLAGQTPERMLAAVTQLVR